jgi:hypothetical protein
MTERRQEDFDRDFTAMVSGLEMDGLDAEEAEPAVPLPEPPDFRTLRPPDLPAADFNLEESLSQASPDEPHRSEYLPPPLPPMRPPRGVAIVAWALFGYSLVALILIIIGVRLPSWAGWAAIVAFVAALILGWRLLPKDRDPGDGDGAVV